MAKQNTSKPAKPSKPSRPAKPARPVAAPLAPPSAAAAGGDEEAPDNALEELAALLGAPRPGVVEAVLAGTSSDALVEDGARIASGRILTDMSRIYWKAYVWAKDADPALLRMVKGFSMPLLAAAVDRALRLKRMAADRRDTEARESSSKEQAARVAAKAVSQSGDLRDQAERVFARVANLEEPFATEVAKAVTAVKTAADRARNLAGLADVAERWLSLPEGTPIRVRAELAGVDADYVAELRASGKGVKKAAGAAEKRATGTDVSQAALDHEDGINLLFLDQIITAFDSANQVNRLVPRFLPIATRTFFGRRPRKKAAEPATPESKSAGKKADK